MPDPKALILVGSRYHTPAQNGDFLAKLFAEAGIASVVTDQGAALRRDVLKDMSLVVFYCEGIWQKDHPETRRLWPEQEKELLDFVKAGGGFLGIHGAVCFDEMNQPYLDMIGGRFVSHPARCEFTVKVEDSHHPVTQGVEDYTIYDEPYVVDRYPGSHVLLTGDWDGEVHPLGWVKTYGEARVCYLANGHEMRSLETPAYQRLCKNAARWCINM